MPEAVETGLEPEYFITNIRIEDIGGGLRRLYAYSLRHAVLHLLYTAVIPARALPTMGRQCLGETPEQLMLEDTEVCH